MSMSFSEWRRVRPAKPAATEVMCTQKARASLGGAGPGQNEPSNGLEHDSERELSLPRNVGRCRLSKPCRRRHRRRAERRAVAGVIGGVERVEKFGDERGL